MNTKPAALIAAVALLGASLGVGITAAGAAVQKHAKNHAPPEMNAWKLSGRMHSSHNKSMWIQKRHSEVRRREGGDPSSRMDIEGGGSTKHTTKSSY